MHKVTAHFDKVLGEWRIKLYFRMPRGNWVLVSDTPEVPTADVQTTTTALVAAALTAETW